MTSAKMQAVQLSFARCLGNPKFFDRFYEIFMSSDAAVKPQFAKTDMTKQKHLLRHGLMSVVMYAENEEDEMAKICLDRIRETHGASRLNIRPKFYRFWVESLIKTISECDPDWKPELEVYWREAVAPAVEHIESGYAA